MVEHEGTYDLSLEMVTTADAEDILTTSSLVSFGGRVQILYAKKYLKVIVCSYPQPHPSTFFKHMEILVPKVESYLEGFMCEILYAQRSV